eukprot:3940718-Rhodomonas_salina.1
MKLRVRESRLPADPPGARAQVSFRKEEEHERRRQQEEKEEGCADADRGLLVARRGRGETIGTAPSWTYDSGRAGSRVPRAQPPRSNKTHSPLPPESRRNDAAASLSSRPERNRTCSQVASTTSQATQWPGTPGIAAIPTRSLALWVGIPLLWPGESNSYPGPGVHPNFDFPLLSATVGVLVGIQVAGLQLGASKRS